MNENDFIVKLQERASEQGKVVNEMPFPKIFTKISVWAGNQPWRIIVPISVAISLLLRLFIGSHYTDFILKIFRTI